jgi:MFS family permease
MFPQRYQYRVQAFLMSVIMVTIMTALITALNTGINDGFVWRWAQAMAFAWPIACCIILIAGKHVMRLSAALCQRD